MELEFNSTLNSGLQDVNEYEEAELERFSLRMLVVVEYEHVFNHGAFLWIFLDFQDDSTLNRKILIRIIESDSASLLGCIITEADDGETAVSIMRQELEPSTSFSWT